MLFNTIALDPPWNEQGGGKVKRGADRWYPLVKSRDMPAVIRGSGLWNPNPDGCSVWLWATANHLPDAITVMQELGVHYVTNLVWVKVKQVADQVSPDDVEQPDIAIGLGQHFRLAHEHLLYGRVGRVPVPAPKDRLPTVVVAAPTRHSAKPERFYQIIDRHDGPGNRLEMFARQPRQGWTVWGNEVQDPVNPTP